MLLIVLALACLAGGCGRKGPLKPLKPQAPAPFFSPSQKSVGLPQVASPERDVLIGPITRTAFRRATDVCQMETA